MCVGLDFRIAVDSWLTCALHFPPFEHNCQLQLPCFAVALGVCFRGHMTCLFSSQFLRSIEAHRRSRIQVQPGVEEAHLGPSRCCARLQVWASILHGSSTGCSGLSGLQSQQFSPFSSWIHDLLWPTEQGRSHWDSRTWAKLRNEERHTQKEGPARPPVVLATLKKMLDTRRKSSCTFQPQTSHLDWHYVGQRPVLSAKSCPESWINVINF